MGAKESVNLCLLRERGHDELGFTATPRLYFVWSSQS